MKLKELIKNVENVELTPEQEKQIKDYLGIKESKRWKPQVNEWFYTIYGDLAIDQSHNDDLQCDISRIAIGNCFKTREEAEFAAEKIKVYQELKNFADENNDPINWSDIHASKYNIAYEHDDNILKVDRWSYTEHIGSIYFSSEKLAWEAIKTVGKDRIKKYLFGVE